MQCSVRQSVQRALRSWAVVSMASTVMGGHALAADETAAGPQAAAAEGSLEVEIQFKRNF